MGRLGKVVLGLVVVAGAVGGGGIAGLRGGRAKVGKPGEIKPGLVTVTNAGKIGLFAARTAPGPHVIVFDAGLDPEGRPIDALLGALQASRNDVTDLFLTHGHVDHISGAHILDKAKVHLGSGDLGLASGQVPPEALIPRLITKTMSPVPVSINAPIASATSFPVGPADAAGGAKMVKAYPVPGHTPGSYAFLYDGVLFVGDIMIFNQGRLDPTPGIFDPNPAVTKASIKSLRTQLAGETVDIVCTAHGGCTPKGLGHNLLEELIDRVGS